ncbi:MAG: hypothetical protein AVDCRST_MAG38-2503, partial [uncultured Solirubrobacteraceae bacterium]
EQRRRAPARPDRRARRGDVRLARRAAPAPLPARAQPPRRAPHAVPRPAGRLHRPRGRRPRRADIGASADRGAGHALDAARSRRGDGARGAGPRRAARRARPAPVRCAHPPGLRRAAPARHRAEQGRPGAGERARGFARARLPAAAGVDPGAAAVALRRRAMGVRAALSPGRPGHAATGRARL